ncbi:MAG: hypothetical protein JWM80_4549 [Cyanobacteria bacterium RYN_339]|nr:hypothetical protein [Cyanobacteria bacterium RYN_339]
MLRPVATLALVTALALAGCGRSPQPVAPALDTPASLQAEAASPRVMILAATQTDNQVSLRYTVTRAGHTETRDVVLKTHRDAEGRAAFASGSVNGQPITAAMVGSAEGKQVVRELAGIGQAKGGGYRVQFVGIIVAVAGGVVAGVVLGAALVIKAIIDALRPCSEGGALC